MQQIIDVDLNKAEAYNMVKDSAGFWSARPALTELINISASEKILYGFSVSSQIGSTYHYILSYFTSNNRLMCYIYTDDWQLHSSLIIGRVIDPSAAITHAVNYSQIIVNSPGFSSPFHAFIGSMLKVAEKVETSPLNPDTPALSLFPGLVCSFADRFVYSYRNQVLINNPGTEPRTITAQNSISCSGIVLDLFQDAQGNLQIITTDSVYTLPPDGLAGAYFQGQVIRTANFSGLYSRNAVSTRLGVFGLLRDGLYDLTAQKATPLTIYKRSRKITKPAGPGAAADFRVGKLFSLDSGLIISFSDNQSFCYIDFDRNYQSWWFEDGDVSNDVVGVCRSDDGTVCLVFPDRICAIYGDSPNCTFGLACEVDLPGIMSQVVREIIITSSANGVGEVRSVIRNSDLTTTASIVPGASVVDTGLYGTAVAVDAEFASMRHQRAVRTDGIYFEVGVDRDMKIESVQVLTRGQGSNRHRNG